MTNRKIQRRPLRKVSIGDMRTPIGIYNSTLMSKNSVDPIRHLEVVIDPWFCSVHTIHGSTMFGESNVEEVITHIFDGRYIDSITVDHMVVYDSRLLRIISTENWEERGEYLRLVCTERGLAKLRVNHA